jgi:hypothetical protein
MAEADTGTWEGRVSGAWANDPWGRHRFRWHDGTAWSAHVSDGTSQGLDPVVLASPAAAPQPSSDEIIERLVQSARAAIDAQLAARPPVAPPQPVIPPQPVAPPQPVISPQPVIPPQPVARTTPAPAVAGVAASKDTRRPVPWAWIAAGIAVPVAVWCLYNARDRDESSSVADVTAESTTTTTTTTAPAPTTTVATPDTIEVDSVPPGAVTAAPVEPVDPALVERCVEFAQFAAYIGDSEMSVFWTNAGLNVDTLRANCAALPPSELERLAQRKADMDLFMTGAPAA